MKRGKTRDNEPIFNIEATIYCLRDSHKGIIIGKMVLCLKNWNLCKRRFRKELQDKVNLQLWVKVREDWINNDKFLKLFKNTD